MGEGVIMLTAVNAKDELDKKAFEFSEALKKYNTISFYHRLETCIAVIVVLLQALTLYNIWQYYSYESGVSLLLTLVVAYFITDFINGFVHMIMDNNTHYNSVIGPYIAAFHMHHVTLKYTDKHPIKIYFTESGHKFWLAVYLIGLTTAQYYWQMDSNLNLGLVIFGILSSVAELSHYWCHKSARSHAFVRFLQHTGFLLRLKHHRLHHVQDNTHYGFLNGCSNPLLNRIAKQFYQGYKTRSDQHVATSLKRATYLE